MRQLVFNNAALLFFALSEYFCFQDNCRAAAIYASARQLTYFILVNSFRFGVRGSAPWILLSELPAS